jgi:YD repeat-containing protein
MGRAKSIPPDGERNVLLESGGGSALLLTRPDGTTEETTLGPDPRFGMAAPVVTKRVVRTPGGRTLTVGASRSVVLVAPDDPLTVAELSDEVTIGGRTWRSVYDAASATVTATTPTGVESVVSLDGLGRPLSARHATLERVLFGYDAHGRLESVEEGAGAAARVTSFGYDPAAGWLSSVVDAGGQSWGLTRDAIGRVVASTRPDGWSTGVVYDAESNVVGVTPPGGWEHGFTYDDDGLMTSYAAPHPETGTPAELVAVDGVVVATFTYDPNGNRDT